MRHNRNNLLRSLFVFTAVLWPFCASNAALDKFEPYAYTRVRHDTNLFKVSGDQEAIAVLGSTNRDDTIAYLGAGAKTDLKLSRQHLLLDLDINRAKYDTYDDLDHTQLGGRAVWRWQVGNLWSGNLGYKYDKKLSSFYQTLVPVKDMRTTKTAYFDAGYDIHPDWKLLVGVDSKDVSFQERDRRDRETNSGRAEIQYKNTRKTRVGVRLKHNKTDLSNDLNIGGVSASNDYNETEISGVFYWEGTGKSSFKANLGYTDLRYDDLDERDFQGTTGRLTYYWELTGKTKLDISIWRETSSFFSEITTYVLAKGVSIRPTWSVTQKISLNGEVSYTNDDFKGQNDIAAALGAQRRDDDTWRYRLSADWEPRQYLQVSLGYQREERDSSIDIRDFDGRQYDVRVTASF